MASQTLPLTLWEPRNETSQWHLDTCASCIFQLVPITPELSMCVHVSYPYPYYAIHAAVLKQDSLKITLTGRSKCMELTQCEADVLTESGLIIPNHLFVYPRLYLADKDRSISSESCCRAIKRNNSCIVYRTDEGPANYGILKNLFFLNDSSVPLSPSPQCYALVQCLSPAPMVLCHDPITQAQLNSHIISFHPPRLFSCA